MSQKMKVLVVDDEPLNVDYLEQRLEDLDYQIITAADGQDALNKIKSEHPDLVLLDLMMPILDGFAVLSEVKADPGLSDIPVIIISADHDSKSIVRGIKQGADDYLTKPVNHELLVKKVKEFLG